MIAQLGQLCLHFALLASLVAALLPLCTKLVPSPTLRYIWLRRLCIASWLGVIVAFLALIFSFAIVDNSVFAVAMHAHPMQPLLYRIGATWGHHEGSLLMWNSITATYMLLFLLQPTRNLKIDFTALWVMQVLLLLFLWFQIETSNPLMRVLADHPGRGLNPVLQDPALAIHPPILYAGYLGAIVAFALAIAGLYQRQLGLEWQNWMRNWVRFSWVLLTLGIMLGSMWAYRELGWGGFWFWDPVENASLLPWLLLTVLLHNISITKNDYSGTALLALISFITVLLGAFLVRSGVLSSVHSFTSDPTRGAILLSLTALVFFASMVLYALRASVLTTESSRPYLARILRLQSWVLYAITLSLFLSILLPLYAELVQQRQIMIGLPYFEHSTIPLTLPLLLLMGVANRTSWRVYLLELLAAGIITYLLLLLADPKPW